MLHHQADPVGNIAIKLEKKRERKIKLWNLESWFFGGKKFGKPKEKKTLRQTKSVLLGTHISGMIPRREKETFLTL